MLQLSQDPSFHYEALRSLAITRYYGSDVSETLNILPRIKPGNFDDWYQQWYDLALRVLSTIDESKESSYSPITLRDVYLRASHYFFVSDFFLHGNPSDPRGSDAFKQWRKYFDKANSLLSIPGIHATVKTGHGFDVPIIIYRTPQASASNPRPTLLVGGGFDSNMEETYHVFGCPALERGYNVILYEGPGQPRLLHEQNKGWIFDWEKAVTPVMDYVLERRDGELSFINADKIGLIGYSLGGYLSARAAAFEPRLAALICIDGVHSFADACWAVFPDAKPAFEAGNVEGCNRAFENTSTSSSTNRRWFHDHLKFSCRLDTGYEVFQRMNKMNLAGLLQNIKMPAFVGEAEEDQFFLEQPAHVAQSIGPYAKLVHFGSDQAAGAHCQSGALVYLNQQLLEWFAEVTGDKK